VAGQETIGYFNPEPLLEAVLPRSGAGCLAQNVVFQGVLSRLLVPVDASGAPLGCGKSAPVLRKKEQAKRCKRNRRVLQNAAFVRF
jgi:hypothetical protein